MEFSAPEPGETVLEIGPGTGNLTEILAGCYHQVIAIEIDPDLIPILEKRFAAFPQVRVILADILNVDLRVLLSDYLPAKSKVVANLPYYISSQVLFRLLGHHDLFSLAILMVQKEVGQRLYGRPKTKDYGSLTLLCQAFAEVSKMMILGPQCFVPRPKVDSSVVRFRFRDTPKVAAADWPLFEQIVKGGFATRRKMLKNSLLQAAGLNFLGSDWEAMLGQLGLPLTVRGEELDLDDFLRLTAEVKARLARD